MSSGIHFKMYFSFIFIGPTNGMNHLEKKTLQSKFVFKIKVEYLLLPNPCAVACELIPINSLFVKTITKLTSKYLFGLAFSRVEISFLQLFIYYLYAHAYRA